MSDVMTQAIIGMPYELAMSDELSRLQFHSRAQELLADYAALEAELTKLRAELERRESHWFSLVMNCAAELETASYCMTDTAAKRIAQSGADHYRKQASAAPSTPATVQGGVKCASCRDVGIIGHSLICPECADSWEPATVQADAVKAKQSEVCDVCEGKGYVNVGDGDAQVACPFCDLPARQEGGK